MHPLEKIYWLRFGLGVAAALICAGYGVAVREIPGDIYLFLNSISLALITYLLSYYVIKYKFAIHVEKPHKLLTTGIGIYFLSWIVFWSLLYTIIATI